MCDSDSLMLWECCALRALKEKLPHTVELVKLLFSRSASRSRGKLAKEEIMVTTCTSSKVCGAALLVILPWVSPDDLSMLSVLRLCFLLTINPISNTTHL